MLINFARLLFSDCPSPSFTILHLIQLPDQLLFFTSAQLATKRSSTASTSLGVLSKCPLMASRPRGKVRQMLHNACLQKHHFVRLHPVLGGVPHRLILGDQLLCAMMCDVTWALLESNLLLALSTDSRLYEFVFHAF